MSGFAPEWLALREAADHDAVNHRLRAALINAVRRHERLRITDLGCGTGSNFRSLAPDIDKPQTWRLVDHDAGLLQIAAAMTAPIATDRGSEIQLHQADLVGGNIAEICADSDLVTAAALFDLVSADAIRRLADGIASSAAIFYTVLTYDGIVAWLPEADLDRAMRNAFNVHQRSDKGFGPAAGPDATDCLAEAFAANGYRVLRGSSPWVLGASLATLRKEVDRGWAEAVMETDTIDRDAIADWLDRRLADESAVTIVGHQDLLALPPA